MKIAVTGATGFIGRYVLKELTKHSVDVTAMVHTLAQSKELDASVQRVVIDIHSPPPDALSLLGHPDVLLHLAWGGLPNYQSLHHIESELPSHFTFLSQLVKAGLPALVGIGTCLEYGMQYGPLSETHKTNPGNPYGFAKNSLRCQLEFLRCTYPFAFTWCRLFYVFGNGQSEKSLYSQLKLAVDRGDSYFNMSGGEQLRDYLPITDVAATLVKLALSQADIGTVNLCSGKPVSVRTLVEKWIEDNKWNIKLNLGYYPYPEYEPMAFWGDRNKLNLFTENT